MVTAAASAGFAASVPPIVRCSRNTDLASEGSDAAKAADAAGDPVTCIVAARLAGIRLGIGRTNLTIDAPLNAPERVVEAVWTNAGPIALVLIGRRTGHRWAPCDVCGEATMIAKGTKPRCRMTPRCTGNHRGRSLPR